MGGGSVATLGSAITMPANSQLGFYTSNGTSLVERMRLDGSGNVGIGTTSPQSLLHIFKAEGGVGTKDATITLGGYTTQGATIASYRFEGDSNSRGLMFSTRNTGVGMVDAVTITGPGNVGIGTTSPGSPLTIVSGDSSTSNNLSISGTGAQGISITTTGTTGNAQAGINYYTTNGTALTGMAATTGRILNTSVANEFIVNNRSGAIVFSTDSAYSRKDLYIATTGNVGIGTTTTTEKLTVAGNLFLTALRSEIYGTDRNHMLILRGRQDGTAVDEMSYHEYGAHVFYTGGAVASQTERLRITSGGNVLIGGSVGIGTVSPGGNLEVVTGSGAWNRFVVTATTLWGDGGSQYVTIGAGGATGIMIFNPHVVWNAGNAAAAIRMGRSGGVSGGAYYDIGTRASDAWSIQKNGAETGLFHINSAGNIGIGTTTSVAKLDVLGNMKVGGGNYGPIPTNALHVQYGNYNDTTNTAQINLVGGVGNNGNVVGFTLGSIKTNGVDSGARFTLNELVWSGTAFTQGNTDLTVLSGGNVGIGTTSPTDKLSIVGSAVASGNISAKGTSTTSLASFGLSSASYLYGINNSPTWNIGNGSYTNNNVTAPDGSATASTLNLSSTSYNLYQTIAAAAGVIHKVGVWIKLGTATNFCIVVNDTSAWNTIGGRCFTSADGLSTSGWTHVTFIFTSAANINLHIGAHSETAVPQQTAGTVFAWNWEITKQNGGSAVSTFNGNVGIGTTNPSSRLFIADPGTTIARTGLTVARADGLMGLSIGDLTSGVGFYLQGANFTNSDKVPILLNPLGGNVGIGTTSPGAQLEVGTNASFTGKRIRSLGYSTSGSSDANLEIGDGGSVYWRFLRNSSNAFEMNLSSTLGIMGGNVGIGTPTPAYKLDVVASSNSDGFRVRQGSTSKFILDGDGVLAWGGAADYGRLTWDTGMAIVAGQSSVDLKLVAGTAYVYLKNSTGNVGIGTTLPRSKLEVVNGSANTFADPAGAAGSFATGTPSGQASTLSLESNEAVAIDSGGVLGFGGRYSGSAYANWASIKGLKTDAIGSNYGGYLSFFTRLNGYSSAERMRISDTGNVGIATTSPVSKLHVAGIGNTVGGNIHMGDNTNATGKWTYLTGAHYNGATNPTGISIIGSYSDAGQNAVVIGGSIYEAHPATNIQFWTHTATTHTTGGSERMRISTNGNVGIGTTAPGQKFEVAGASGVIGLSVYDTGDANGDTTQINLGASASLPQGAVFLKSIRTSASGANTDFAISTTFSGSQTERMRVDSVGNVGIGTTSPSAKLHTVNTVDAAGPIFENTGGRGSITVKASSTNSAYVNFGNANGNSRAFVDFRESAGYLTLATSFSGGYIAFNTDSQVERVRILSTGNVGIGTTTPGSKLSVAQDMTIGADLVDSTAQMVIQGVTTPGKKLMLGYDTNGNGFGFIKAGNLGVAWTNLALQPNAGSVSIGTTSATYKLDVNGIAYAATDFRAPIFYDSANTGYYTDPASTSNLNALTVNSTFTVNNGYSYVANNYGYGIVGLYSSTVFQLVFAMGDAYKTTAGGGISNLYGIAWSHPSAGGIAANLNTHGALVTENGAFLAAISGSIRCRDDMRAPIFYDSNNTAYYTDPNSTSNLLGLTVTNTITGSISGNAATAYGLNVHTGRNNEVNKVVRTDGSGYIQAGWINTDSGDSGFATRLTRITCSNDNYLRYLGLTDFKVSIGESAKNNYSRRIDYSSDANYHVGSFGAVGYGANETFHGGSGFFDIWSGTNYPSGLSHIHGFNALHYTASSLGSTGGNAYGWQMAAQYNSDTGPWWRRCNGGSFSSWLKLVSYGNNTGGDIYAQRYYDSDNTAYYVDPASTSNLNAATFAGAVTTTGGLTTSAITAPVNTLTTSLNAGQTLTFTNTGGGSGAKLIANQDMTFGANTGGALYLFANNSTALTLASTGAATFAGAVATGNLTVTGAITATGNITAYFSDDRLKTRLGPITNALGKLKSLSGFYFEPNQTAQDLGYEKKTDVGVSAQEVQAVLPEIIAPAPIDAQYMTVRYEKLIPLLIEAIKAQQVQIEELKAQIIIIQQTSKQ